MTVKTHTQIRPGGQRLFICLFLHSDASMIWACARALEFCAVKTLKFAKI
jgi:hypothetical protein